MHAEDAIPACRLGADCQRCPLFRTRSLCKSRHISGLRKQQSRLQSGRSYHPISSNGVIVRPPDGGFGRGARADKVYQKSPSHDRNPKQCRWYDKEDHHWECHRCKMNYGRNKPGHLLIPGKCRFAKPWQLPDKRGQPPPADAAPATASPAAPAAE